MESKIWDAMQDRDEALARESRAGARLTWVPPLRNAGYHHEADDNLAAAKDHAHDASWFWVKCLVQVLEAINASA